MSLLVLSIIDKSLAIALEVVKGIPDEQKSAFWERHERRIEWLQGLFDRTPEEPPDAR